MKINPPRLRTLPRDSGDLRLALAQLAEKLREASAGLTEDP